MHFIVECEVLIAWAQVFKASPITLLPASAPRGGNEEEVEFSHLWQSNDKDNNMDNDLYDLGAAMSHEHSVLRDIDSDLGDATSGRRGNDNEGERWRETRRQGQTEEGAGRRSEGAARLERSREAHEGAERGPARGAAFPSIADSNSVYCNTVCKPGTDYNSKDNVSDKSLIPLSMTSCLGQVGSNCKPEACDDNLCMDALAGRPPPPDDKSAGMAVSTPAPTGALTTSTPVIRKTLPSPA